MGLTTLTSVSFWQYCLSQYTLSSEKSMTVACWLSFRPCIFGWRSCHFSPTKKKGHLLNLSSYIVSGPVIGIQHFLLSINCCRFLYPIYPLICVSASAVIENIPELFREKYSSRESLLVTVSSSVQCLILSELFLPAD